MPSGRHRTIKVLDGKGKRRRHISADEAMRLVANEGFAWASDSAVIPDPQLKESYQGAAIELAAIERHRKYVVGGLVRQENKPEVMFKECSLKVKSAPRSA